MIAVPPNSLVEFGNEMPRKGTETEVLAIRAALEGFDLEMRCPGRGRIYEFLTINPKAYGTHII